MSRASVHVLDDNDSFRRSTAWLIESLEHDVHEYAEPCAAVPLLIERGAVRPSCLLLDIRMPGMSGLDVHDALAAAGSDLPIVYMTGHGDVPLAVSAMKKGAFTFLQKPLDPAQLADTLEEVLAPAVQHCRGARVAPESAERTRERIAQLSRRELQIVRGLVSDRTNREMAEELHIAVKTVELYRSRALKKLQAKNAAQLVRMVLSCDAR